MSPVRIFAFDSLPILGRFAEIEKESRGPRSPPGNCARAAGPPQVTRGLTWVGPLRQGVAQVGPRVTPGAQAHEDWASLRPGRPRPRRRREPQPGPRRWGGAAERWQRCCRGPRPQPPGTPSAGMPPCSENRVSLTSLFCFTDDGNFLITKRRRWLPATTSSNSTAPG